MSYEQVREQAATLASIIMQGFENQRKELHTALPGEIVSFDAVKQTAAVQPTVRRVFKTVSETGQQTGVQSVDLPQLINVPVLFPRGGGFSLTFPVTPGDECLIIFAERAIDFWHKNSGVQDPGGKRFHDLSDGICFVGLSSIPKKVPGYSTDAVQLKKDDGSATVDVRNGEIRLITTSKVVCDTPEVEFTGNGTVAGNLRVEGNVSSGGDVTTDTGISLNSHTHIGSPSAPTGPVTDTGAPK